MNYTLLIILLLVVSCVSSLSDFIDKGSRAELFELTDNEVPVIKITLKDEDFIKLKNSVNQKEPESNEVYFSESIQDVVQIGVQLIELLKLIDFGKMYPGYNFTNILPELNINESGKANLNTEEIIKGFNLDNLKYTDLDLSEGTFFDSIISRNQDFNLNHIGVAILMLNEQEKSYDDPYFKMFINILDGNKKEAFETGDASMTVELNGELQKFKKIKFKIGGESARSFGKQGYNIKIKNGQKLFGRKDIRLRADASEATFLRTKLTCDIHNRLGLPSISANYATLYINDEYMGFYILLDIPKLSWIESVFDDKDTEFLYQCKAKKSSLSLESSATTCTNKNDDVTDNTEWIQFLTKLDQAESSLDVEDIFDVDLFLTEVAIEYLIGSWDHFLINGHNYYLYKAKDNKWKFILYDFDFTFGQDIDLYFVNKIFLDVPEQFQIINREYHNYSFDQWARPSHLIDILIFKDASRFENILKQIVQNVFNPSLLYSRIDELKDFIRPYVELDKISNDEGKYPGKLNLLAYDYSLKQWEANSEFTSIETALKYRAYGLKYWILAKYRYVCRQYNIECDETYTDNNFQYSIDKEVEAEGYNVQYETNTDLPTETPIETPTINPTETPIETPTDISTETIIPKEQVILPDENYQCWAEVIGYPCCSSDTTKVYSHDDNGDWGYDFDKNEWCGLTPYKEYKSEKTCWSEKLGYECCNSCTVYEKDVQGSWGYDHKNKKWCGIPSYCPI